VSRSARREVAVWGRFALLAGITAVVLVPVVSIVGQSLRGSDGDLDPIGFVRQVAAGPALGWVLNSVVVSLATVVVVLVVGAPAGYVLARIRNRGVDASSVVLFAAQSLPTMVLLPPMFVLVAHVGGVDGRVWVGVVYVSVALAVAIWMLRAGFAALPIDAEEAAWLDGCGVLGGFLRVALPNAVPALLSAGLFTFLLAWNDYWIALVFIQDPGDFTVGLALVSGGRTPALTLVALLPPLIAFVALRRWFRFGGAVDPAR
jgi:multiple sugar transport system permease protein